MNSSKQASQAENGPRRRARRTEKRQASLYDAVSGRVSTTTQLATSAAGVRSTDGGTYSLRDATLAPEEVLFQRRGAPQRYAEKDLYHSQHEALPDAGRGLLPDSDLLKAVHGYAAAFYEQLATPAPGQDPAEARAGCFMGTRHVDERSMDETALVAFGILLEEAGREVLGRRGDLVFTEGLVEEDEQEDGPGTTSSRRGRSNTPRWVGATGEGSVHHPAVEGEVFWRRAYPKRRKITGGAGKIADRGAAGRP